MGAPNLKGPSGNPLWKPGTSGNPSGRPRIPDELRGIRSLSQLEVCKLVSKYAQMLPSDLDAVIESRSVPMLEMAIAQIFAKSAQHGDYQRLSFLLDRAIGKVLVVEPTDEETEARRKLEEMTDLELVQMARDKMKILEKAE